MYDTWAERGGKDANDIVSFDTNPRKLYFTSKDSYIGGICLANVSDSLTITFDRIANVGSLQPMRYNFDIVQQIASNDEVTAGVSVNYYAEARSQAMEPAVDIEETRGEYVLRENNITEDATYQWYDANGTTVASGKVATIDASKASGTYKLKVKAASDGAVNYATVSLDKIPVMEAVSPSPFDNELTISLRRAAKGSTHVLITGVTNPSVQKDFLMRNGESRMTIYTSNYPKGTYLVTIMEDGEILDTKTVVK